MKVSVVSIALAAVSLMIGAGCGDDDGSPAATNGDAAGITSVAMDEYRLDPADVSIERGATLVVENDGKIAHNLKIERGPDPKKKTEELAGTSTFLPGSSEKLTVDLEPGRYAMVCTVPGHRQLGMTGTLTVK
jgi:uncharacterized cupredoxin-like copper-binding protein